jgi:hypothetical protein
MFMHTFQAKKGIKYADSFVFFLQTVNYVLLYYRLLVASWLCIIIPTLFCNILYY